MDDFGVLVKDYGINPKGKSAPMASTKKAPRTQNNFNSVHQDPNFFSQPFSKSNSGSGSLLDDHNDDINGFKPSNNGQSYVSGDVFDDVFKFPTQSSGLSNGSGGGFDFDVDLMGNGSMNSGLKSNSFDVNVDGDSIWGFSGKSDSSSSSNVGVGNGDLLSSDPVDDFWGKMAKLSLDQSGVKRLKDDKVDSDDLIPGFGRSNTVNDRGQTFEKEKKSSISSLDELEDFATRKINKDANENGNSFRVKSPPRNTVKHNPRETDFFDFDISVGGDSLQKEEMEKVDNMFQSEAPDLDLFFGAQTKKSTPISQEPTMNTKAYEQPNLFTGASFGIDKKVYPSDYDFSSMFEGSSASGVFEEMEGESDERRSLRFARYQRAKARMKNALAEMNQREFKAQQEQEERHRIADSMEMEMKSWAAGKEGNLRALLSSLQQVLGPEFGWRSVSLTDLITSSQVKLAYKKAALCIHPDKVQQRGADLRQKYVAEKAFDLLKEAWNKFSTEELR